MAARVIGEFFRHKIAGPLLTLLRQGATPEKIALGLALGMVIGVTPLIGSTTLLCMLAAFLLRLNPAAIQLVNYVMLPVQLMLLIPFYRAGEWVFGSAHNPITLDGVRQLIQANIWKAILTLWTSTIHALAVWAVVGLLASYPVYMLLLPPLRKLARIRMVAK
jgi:uncharacterized protein (DUF2062 family)